MKIFDAAQTAALLPHDRLLDRLEAMFAAGTRAPLRHHHTLPKTGEPDGTMLLMPAWTDDWGVVKIANVTPGNAARNLPAVSASVLLFNARTGVHEALFDGATVTARRTAGAGALGARLLARPDSRTLLVVGAGRVGAELPAAFRAALPIERALVWNPTPKRGKALVASLRGQGWEADWRPDLQSAVGDADVISCATLATEPLIKGEWLRPGQHLDLIGAFTPQMREVDDLALQRASIFVDSYAALVEAGELKIPLDSGAIAREDILGTLYDLCGKPRRARAADEITVFKGVGNAVMDLAAAMAAMETAREQSP